MAEIILISTVHEEMGKAKAEELYLILEKIQPDVIFLEALETSYPYYDRMRFENFGVYSSKLELKAIQQYRLINEFEYVPVLDNEMSKVFNEKYNLLCENKEFQNMLDNFNNQASEYGFSFLNSEFGQMLHREMREYEDKMIQNLEVKKQFNDTINEYEDSMVKNIRTYCEHNQFNRAVFLCGVAHRKSLIGKLDLFVEFKVNLP